MCADVFARRDRAIRVVRQYDRPLAEHCPLEVSMAWNFGFETDVIPVLRIENPLQLSLVNGYVCVDPEWNPARAVMRPGRDRRFRWRVSYPRILHRCHASLRSSVGPSRHKGGESINLLNVNYHRAQFGDARRPNSALYSSGYNTTNLQYCKRDPSYGRNDVARSGMDLRKIDLNLLLVFAQLFRERLDMSQPGVSNALNRLRVLLGDELFVRTPHGMEPTSYAMRLAGPVTGRFIPRSTPRPRSIRRRARGASRSR